MNNEQNNNQNRYKHTLNLPQTDFSIRANAATTEPALLARWAAEKLDEQAYWLNDGHEKFVLHDGPPYANGPIHLGSAFNKILKDIVCKYKRMSGFHVPLKPGWDCHGLPIELKAVAAENKACATPSALTIIEECRKTAQHWINEQRTQFKELGVLALWENPYITMSPSYEADIVRAFADFVQKGHIVRMLKTVPWCATCKTALATAEIEYKDRKDPSCYILFQMPNAAYRDVFPTLSAAQPNLSVSLLVWTTTPWTIPLNRAVVLNPDANYVVVQGPQEQQAFVVGKDVAGGLCEMLGIPLHILAECDASAFNNVQVHHPLFDNKTVPVIFDAQVTTSDGTACMHMAPGCGPEDYAIARREGIEIYSPLTADGKYDMGIEPTELDGMSIADGQIWVIKKLAERGMLLHKSSIRHSYPHCWRCRNGLMFRATEQWFCNLQHNQLMQRALKESNAITFVPASGKARFQATIGGRAEWCISRQRVWGVPIVALLCKPCGEPFLNEHFITTVANGVERDGIEYWHTVTIEGLVASGALANDFACSACHNKDWTLFEKEMDILDVWFDSGISHTAVLEKYPELAYPADVYLEGSDQHRGWFQSAFLSAMVMHDTPCMKSIVTHGYVVDAHGQKMSKSLGNVIAPSQVIEQYSRDILRLWVASVDFSSDMVISDTLLKNVAEVYRKIRNTCRFLLSNLYDFNHETDAVALEHMLSIDQYALMRLHEVSKTLHTAYGLYDIALVSQALSHFCTSELSAFFLDIMKDRLYTAQAASLERRSAQTACWHIIATLTELMAPVLSFLAQEVTDHLTPGTTIHLQAFKQTINVWEALRKHELTKSNVMIPHKLPTTAGMEIEISYAIEKHGQWRALLELRDVVLKAIEQARAQGMLGHSLEARVVLYLDPADDDVVYINSFLATLSGGQTAEQFLSEFFIVSQVERVATLEGVEATALPWARLDVTHARGEKCPRCWQWDEQPGTDNLCRRCMRVLNH